MVRIEQIKKRYKNEWVLVEVLEEDDLGRPKEVKLLAHSKNRDQIYKAVRESKERYTYQFYTGKRPKKGYAVAFSG